VANAAVTCCCEEPCWHRFSRCTCAAEGPNVIFVPCEAIGDLTAGDVWELDGNCYFYQFDVQDIGGGQVASVFNGPFTDCDDCCDIGPEPQACCLPDLTCENLVPSECLAMGGTPQGEGVLCDDVDCDNCLACPQVIAVRITLIDLPTACSGDIGEYCVSMEGTIAKDPFAPLASCNWVYSIFGPSGFPGPCHPSQWVTADCGFDEPCVETETECDDLACTENCQSVEVVQDALLSTFALTADEQANEWVMDGQMFFKRPGAFPGAECVTCSATVTNCRVPRTSQCPQGISCSAPQSGGEVMIEIL
jgi:hypothetical protein